MSRDPSDNQRNLPPWLRGVPLPQRPAAPGGAEPLPAWMQGMGASSPDAPADESAPLPPWLRDEPAADTPPAAPARDAEAETIPAWLAGTAEPAPDAQGGEQLPDWLRDLAGDEELPAGAAAPSATDWLRDAVPPTAAPAAADADTPDWLRNLSEPPPEPKPAAEMPDWLREDTPAAPPAATPAAPASPAEDVPDWLREDTPAAPAPAAAEIPDWLREDTPAAPPAPAAAEIPDWLREDTLAAPPAPAGPAAQAPPQAESAAPDWLNDIGRDPAPPASAAPELPSWLQESAAEPQQPATPDEDPGLTPFSLADLGITPTPTTPPAVTPPPSSESGWFDDIGGAAEASAPAWLGTAGDTPAPERDEPADVPAWLRDISGVSESAAPAAPTPPAPAADADVPAWLRDMAPASPPEAPAPQPSAPAKDLPDWLKPAPQPAAPEGGADLPEWLRPSGDAGAPAQPAAEAAPDIPDWLRTESAQPAAPEGGADLPEWLRPSGDAAAAPVPSAPAQPAAEAAPDIPDWLRASAEPAAPAAPDLPSWLKVADTPTDTPADVPAAPAGAGEESVPPWLHDEAGQPLPSAAAPGEAGLPEWLRGAPTESRGPSQPPAQTPQAPSGAPSLDWFGDEEEGQAAPPPGDSQLLGSVELPAWLKAETEPKPKPDTSAVDTRSVDWLTRLGVHEEEAVATATATTPRLAPPRTPSRSATQVEAAALLRQLAAAPYPEAAPAPAAEELPIWRRIGLERALYLLLLIVIVAGLAAPGLTSGLQATPQVSGASEIVQQIDALSENDVVLLGYEWDARRVSELRRLEQAVVIDHLIAKRVKLVLVSTDPQGALLQFDLRDKIAAAQYRQYGEGYLLLGYKPGGELALRSMAQDFGGALRADFEGEDATVSAVALGLDTQRPITSVRDFSMTIVLADEAADVQAWMEQIEPVVRGSGNPMLFLLPAEAAPIVQPYMRLPGVWHLDGYQGALAYDTLRGDTGAAGQSALATGQLRLATLAFVALLVVGALGVGVSAAAGRRKG